MKAHNTAAALYILNIITVKIITMNSIQCHRESLPEKLPDAQLLIQFSLSFTQHLVSLLFSPQPDS